MREGIQVEFIAGRLIAIKGVGKMFYQEGFPLSMAITTLAEQGIEVSLLHLADEMIREGNFPLTKKGECTAYKKISSELSESIQGDTKPSLSMEILHEFCHSDYERQRELIFQYLFGCPSADVILGKNQEAKNKATTSFCLALIKQGIVSAE